MNGMEVIPFRHSKSGVCAKVMWNFSTFEGPIMLASEECATGYSTEWVYCSCLLRAEDVSHLNDYPTIEEAGLDRAHFRHKKAKWTQLHGFIFITTQKLKCTKIQLPPHVLDKTDLSLLSPKTVEACLSQNHVILPHMDLSARWFARLEASFNVAWGFTASPICLGILYFSKNDSAEKFPSQSLVGTTWIHWIISYAHIFSNIYLPLFPSFTITQFSDNSKLYWVLVLGNTEHASDLHYNLVGNNTQ